jgi:Na+-translocating ferredoxin:NAD+ oxidoreductase RnfC subunit
MSRTPRNGFIVDAIRDAGVVGAGGAGFPTHVKLSAKVNIVIANGVECEPLLASDQAVMTLDPEKVLAGLKAAMIATGAKRGYVALKKKYRSSVAAIRDVISGHDDIGIFELEDFYPYGDEHVLTHEVTGRYVPEGGLPLESGVVVTNVITLANIADALEGKPVTRRIVTVVGEVQRPVTVSAPVGTAITDLIRFAGGSSVEDCEIILGGPIMESWHTVKTR